MNVVVDEGGEVKVKPPLSRAGDFIELRAEMNLLCGLTSCSRGEFQQRLVQAD
jgi:uncharacterized protein YcgI (DUF1989 family)